MTWEHDRQTRFLEELIHRTDSADALALLRRLSQARKEEQCMRRAVLAASVVLLISLAGFAYAMVLWADLHYPAPRFLVHCASGTGLASIVSVVVFLVWWWCYRVAFKRLHEEARDFILSQLGLKPAKAEAQLAHAVLPPPDPGQ